MFNRAKYDIICLDMPIFVPRDRTSLFRQFLSGMYDAVIITDPNGHILEINARAEEYFGVVQDEVLDQPISNFITGLVTEVVQRIRRGLAENHHMVIDANGLNRQGGKFSCEVTVSEIDLSDPNDLVFTIRNTERRRAINNTYRAKSNAFQVAHCALFGCDREGNIRDVNDAFLEMFGLADEEEARQHVFTDFMGDAPLPENFKKALEGETTVTGLVAEGEGDNQEELEIILAPNLHGRKNHGVVGSILKV